MERLPIIENEGKRHFVDLRLREFRPVDPLIEFIPFDSESGREIVEIDEPEKGHSYEEKQITIECSECRKVLFEGSARDAKGLIIYCTDCCVKDQ